MFCLQNVYDFMIIFFLQKVSDGLHKLLSVVMNFFTCCTNTHILIWDVYVSDCLSNLCTEFYISLAQGFAFAQGIIQLLDCGIERSLVCFRNVLILQLMQLPDVTLFPPWFMGKKLLLEQLFAFYFSLPFVFSLCLN